MPDGMSHFFTLVAENADEKLKTLKDLVFPQKTRKQRFLILIRWHHIYVSSKRLRKQEDIMGQKSCHFANCTAVNSADHPFIRAVNGHLYCKDHVCHVCFDRPKGYGYGGDFCLQHVCTNVRENGERCKVPKENIDMEICNGCWEASMLKKSWDYTNKKISSITWTPTHELERTINAHGDVMVLESLLQNEVTALFRMSGLYVTTVIENIGKAIANGIEGAVSTYKMTTKSVVGAKDQKDVFYYFNGAVTAGEVSVKVLVVIHTVVHTIKHRNITNGYDDAGVNVKLPDSGMLIHCADGSKVSKNQCFATCTGLLVVKTAQIPVEAFPDPSGKGE